MAYSQSACPICSTVTTDPKQEKCDRCHWVLNTENLLAIEVRNSLIEWAMCHYQRADKIDKKDIYNRNITEGRLSRQRDDIDRLQRTIDSFVNIPEIKSILSLNQINISQKTDVPEIQTIDSIDRNNLLSTTSDTE